MTLGRCLGAAGMAGVSALANATVAAASNTPINTQTVHERCIELLWSQLLRALRLLVGLRRHPFSRERSRQRRVHGWILRGQLDRTPQLRNRLVNIALVQQAFPQRSVRS